MRVYSLVINDDTLNDEQREQAERMKMEYEDYGEGEYRRYYFSSFNDYDNALEIIEGLEEFGCVDWILRSFNDMPD
jgi:hypothetical protein